MAYKKIADTEHLYLDDRTEMIYFIRRMGGERYEFPCGFKMSDKDALRKSKNFANRELRKRLQQGKKPKNVQQLMGEHIDAMINEANKKYLQGGPKNTYDSTKNSFNKLKPYFENHLPDEVTSDEWLNFIDYFLSEYPGFNCQNVTKYMKKLCTRLHNQGLIKIMPDIINTQKEREKSRLKKRKSRIYTDEEILRLDAACDDDQRLALYLGFTMGFRIGDCTDLSWDRISLKKTDSCISFFGEDKTNTYTDVPISDIVYTLLVERKKSIKSPWVFPLKTDPLVNMTSQQLKFEKVVRGSGVNYGSFHTLRHTCLTRDFSNPAIPDSLVMKLRRVSLPVALENYIKPGKDDHNLIRNSILFDPNGGLK